MLTQGILFLHHGIMNEMIRKCRKCGKKFNAILDVWYCSGQCERLAANPVAKFIRSKFSIHKPKKGKGSYDRRKAKRDYTHSC